MKPILCETGRGGAGGGVVGVKRFIQISLHIAIHSAGGRGRGEGVVWWNND
jgi:hypothetical protein